MPRCLKYSCTCSIVGGGGIKWGNQPLIPCTVMFATKLENYVLSVSSGMMQVLYFHKSYKLHLCAATKKRFKTMVVSPVFKTVLSVREVWGSIPGSVKSNTVSLTTRHRCDVSSELRYPSDKPRR